VKEFDNPKECAAAKDMDARCKSQDWFDDKRRRNKRAKNRQVRCAHCRRYCWPEDQCNFFESFAQASESTGEAK
jgi:predicted SprT family Zn-dependent metalloprotease